MSDIYIQNNKISIKRAIFYGCSHTSGQELPDHDLLGMSFEEMNEFKKTFANSTHFFICMYRKLKLTHARYNEISKNYTYGKIVCDRLGIDYINRALPGSSNKESYCNIVSDLTQNRYLPGDVVFIGITSFHRDMFLSDKGDRIHYLAAHKESLLENSNCHSALLQLGNDYNVLLQDSLVLISMANILQSNNIPFAFIDSEHDTEGYSSRPIHIMNENTTELNAIYDYAIRPVLPIGNPYSVKSCLGTPDCGFGHASPKRHQHFANILYNYLTNNGIE